jgi:predicted ATP-grasp superfamily ATP-dependent carboligase
VQSETAGPELVATLTALAENFDEQAVLVPCTDASVLTLSRARGSLTAAYAFALPDPETVELLADKARFAAWAAQRGLAVPRTLVLESAADAEQAAATLRFPCIVKPPVKTARWEQLVREKAFKVETPEALLTLHGELAPATETLLAQEWIPGLETDHFTCNAYFDRDGVARVTFVTQKIRQWPPQTGVGSLAIESRNDVVRDETVRLFSALEFRGLAYLELKRDPGTGEHLIVEPNIGRPTGRSAAAEAAGVELLYTMYCDLLGLPLPAAHLAQRYGGTKWVYLGRDLRSAFHYWRRGELSLRAWADSLRGPIVDAVFSWRDPLPFVFDVLRAPGLLRRRVSPA